MAWSLTPLMIGCGSPSGIGCFDGGSKFWAPERKPQHLEARGSCLVTVHYRMFPVMLKVRRYAVTSDHRVDAEVVCSHRRTASGCFFRSRGPLSGAVVR